MLLDPETNEPTRIGSKTLPDGHARAYRPQERRGGGQMSKTKQTDDQIAEAKAAGKAAEGRQGQGSARPKASASKATPSRR